MVKRPLHPKKFFTKEERNEIVSAICDAERKTSGEIRVYLERKSPRDLMKRAKAVFEKLGMTRTKRKNGVLFYLCLNKRQFVILGDRGIHEKVEKDFWKSVALQVERHFAQGEFVKGVVSGIIAIGEKLKTHFPWEPGDTNELSNAV